MKKFYIITNKAKDADYSFTKEIERYLQKNGAVCLSSNQEQTGGDTDYRYTDASIRGDIPDRIRFRQIQSALLYLAGTER